MRYLDDLAKVPYKKDSQGRTLFFPWGCMGAGYVIDTEARLKQLRQFYKRIYLFSPPFLLLIILLQQLMVFYYRVKGRGLFLLFFFAWQIWLVMTVKRLTSGLELNS